MKGEGTFNATTNIIGVIIQKEFSEVNIKGKYTFNLVPYSNLSGNARIIIEFPLLIDISEASDCISKFQNIQVNCIIQINSKTLTINNLFSLINIFQGNNNLQVIINNIKNPRNTLETSPFHVRTYYDNQNNYPVDQNKQVTIISTKTLLNINQVNINSESDIVYDKTKYTINFRNKNSIYNNGNKLRIYIPYQIQVDQNIDCFISINNFQFTKFENTLFFDQNGVWIEIDSFTNEILFQGTLISIRIQNLTNPKSTQTVSGFALQTYSQGSILDYINNINFSVDTPTSMQIQIFPTNKTNGQVINYIFSIKIPIDIVNNSYLQIQFPSQIVLQQSTIQCQLDYQSIINNINCKLIKTMPQIVNIEISSTKTFIKNKSINLQIKQIKNHFSTKTSGNFKYTLFCNDRGNKIAYLQGTPITNTFHKQIQVNVRDDSKIMKQEVELTITFIVQNTINKNNFVQIVIPQQYYVGSGLTCTGINVKSFKSLNNKIRLQLNGTTNSGSNFVVIIQGCNNPLVNFSQKFIINTYQFINNQFYVMDSGTSFFAFQLGCQLYCKQCTPNNIFQCLNCYDDSILFIQLRIYFEFGSCVDNCSPGNYKQQSTLTCQKCSTNCETCSQMSLCLSCGILYPYLHEKTCVNFCPKNYFINKNVKNKCQKCNQTCQTCQNQSSHCLICNSNYFLHLNNCLQNCPNQFYQHENICLPCPKQCLTCISPYQCIICKDGYWLNQQKLCTNTCQLANQFQNNEQCQLCDDQCKTCYKINNNCTSCETTFLYNNKCQNNCPIGYFPQISIYQCLKCRIPCFNCSDIQTCLSCIPKYFLDGNICQSKCSLNKIPIQQVCTKCNEQIYCGSCQGYLDNCTSCLQNKYLLIDTEKNPSDKTDYLKNICIANCKEYNKSLIGINGICIACVHPCLQCRNHQTICTKCNSTTFLIGNKCVQQCGITKYQKQTPQRICDNCKSLCLQCTNNFDCTLCIENLFLYKNNCLNSCQLPLISYNNQCVSCNQKCLLCIQTPQKCTLCPYSKLYLNYDCIDQCPNNYFLTTNRSNCTNICLIGCFNCQQIQSNCSSCIQGYYLFQNQCFQICPIGFFGLDYMCQQCDSICQQCKLNKQFCTKCKNNLFLVQSSGNCYYKCPQSYPQQNNFICYKCKQFCRTCNQEGKCQQCIGNTYLYNNTCVQICPENFKISQDLNNCIDSNIMNSGNFFPFTIISGIILLIVIISKYYSNQTFFQISIVGILAIFQIISWIIFASFLYQRNAKSQATYILIVTAIIFLFIFNLIHVILFYFHLYKDDALLKWKQNKMNVKAYWILLILSLFSFRIYVLSFSRFLNLKIFRSNWSSSQLFYPFMILKSISIFMNQILVIIACFIYASKFKDQNDKYKLFYQSIDTLIITIIMMIFLILYICRPKKNIFLSKFKRDMIQSTTNNLNETTVVEQKYKGIYYEQSFRVKFGKKLQMKKKKMIKQIKQQQIIIQIPQQLEEKGQQELVNDMRKKDYAYRQKSIIKEQNQSLQKDQEEEDFYSKMFGQVEQNKQEKNNQQNQFKIEQDKKKNKLIKLSISEISKKDKSIDKTEIQSIKKNMSQYMKFTDIQSKKKKIKQKKIKGCKKVEQPSFLFINQNHIHNELQHSNRIQLQDSNSFQNQPQIIQPNQKKKIQFQDVFRIQQKNNRWIQQNQQDFFIEQNFLDNLQNQTSQNYNNFQNQWENNLIFKNFKIKPEINQYRSLGNLENVYFNRGQIYQNKELMLNVEPIPAKIKQQKLFQTENFDLKKSQQNRGKFKKLQEIYLQRLKVVSKSLPKKK